MPINGEQQGYTYKALIDGVWQEVTIQESPLELVERFGQDEEWTRVGHGHWSPHPFNREWDVCSACGIGTKRREYGLNPDGSEYVTEYSYRHCPNCGAKMDEVEE